MPEHTTWMDDRVEAFLDDVLPDDEHVRFVQTLADDADWEAELFLARQISDGLHALPEPLCPPHVTEAVLAQVRTDARTSALDRLNTWFQEQWMALWQPALAMAVLVLLVVSAALVGRPAQQEPTTAEVQQALADVQWTLALLSEVGRDTGQAVRHDVLEERVVAPVQEAITGRPKFNETQR